MNADPLVEQNLLLGVLAYHMDFVRRAELIAALESWVQNKRQPFEEVLAARGKLTADDLALLRSVVQRQLRKQREHPDRTLQGSEAFAALQEDLKHLGDRDLQTYLAQYTALPPAPEGKAAPGAAAARFRIVRKLAEGSLGEVFLARDEELEREVAVKEIRKEIVDRAEARARFLREAEIAAKLEHAGIVPIYGIGSYGDGRPFYAMRYIQGTTFKEAIKKYHALVRPGTAERAATFRELLRRFVAVCHAIAYAHNQGVLHRDIKPGNIMIGTDGDTLVVDWGLAKAFASGKAGALDGTILPGSQTEEGLTVQGQILGTPEYMSPEQAAGEIDRLGPASDICSLGGTLYCLLTGEPPYRRTSDELSILTLVQRGRFRHPAQVRPGVPAGLAAVCLKAMENRPQDRYPSATALAADVERWLAGEPVSVYREPLPQRLARWAGAHPRSAVALVALAVLLPLALLAAFALGERSDARSADLEQRAEFLASELDKSRQAYDSLRDAARQAEQQHQQREAAQHRELADEREKTRAAEQLSRAAEQQRRSAEAKRQRAEEDADWARWDSLAASGLNQQLDRKQQKTRENFDLLWGAMAKLPQSKAALGAPTVLQRVVAVRTSALLQALSLYEGVLQVNNGTAPALLARAVFPLGLAAPGQAPGLAPLALAQTSSFLLPFPAPGQDLSRAEQAVVRTSSASVRRETGLAHRRIAEIQHALGGKERDLEAEKAYQRAADTFEQLVKDFAEEAAFRRDLGQAQLSRAVFFKETERPQEAQKWYAETINIQEKLVAKHQEKGDEADLSQSYNNLAYLLARSRKMTMMPDAERAVELAEKAVKLAPTPAKKATCQMTLALAQYRAAALGDAVKTLAQALELGKQDDPAKGPLSRGGCEDYFVAAMILAMRDAPLARQYFDAAQTFRQERFPEDRELAEFYAEAGTALGVPVKQ